MSHHFDTPTAREDPRLNLCDYYLFRGKPGMVTMALTVNPDAGRVAPDTFREEGVYAFRFDTDQGTVAFKFTFGPPSHGKSGHVQAFEVRRGAGPGKNGDLIAQGDSGEVMTTGVSVFAGLAPDVFAGDAVALKSFQSAFNTEGRFYPQAFQNRKNFFFGRNVTVIVFEVPIDMVGSGRVRGWATVSLEGHAPEVQVSRWGMPLVTHLFMPDPEMRESYNRSTPAEDISRFGGQIEEVVEKLVALAGSAVDAQEYARRVAARLLPTTLPYDLGTAAGFDFAGFNGRGLLDDVMDVMLTLATNTPLGDGVVPDPVRVQKLFPYFGPPYTSVEQSAMLPPVTKN